MSVLDSQEVLRPAPTGVKAWIGRMVFAAVPWFFSVLRRVKPIARVGGMVLTSRHDDVREVFARDPDFGVVYAPKLDVIMGGEPFFLGMGDTPEYRADTAALRRVVRREDLPRLAAAAEARAAALVAASGGEIEVVQLVRDVTFDVLGPYFGVTPPPGGNLQVWATRLFEFQFADGGNDPALRAEVNVLAPALRAHIDTLIAEAHAGGGIADSVLARSVAMQQAGEAGFEDVRIRTALMGLVVGGPPQPPMVVPQAMEQLLRRPQPLAEAQAAARAGDDALLARYVFEAMRFDPLAPGLPRVALADTVIAAGTPHAAPVKAGETVLAAFASAMMDPRRVADPRRFDPWRPPSDYIHFGYALHQCFGLHINMATLHLMLKPLLQQPGLRRAPGAAGRLRKRGAFADRLVVRFGGA